MGTSPKASGEISISSRWVGAPFDGGRLRKALDLGFRGIALHEEVRERDFEEIIEFLPPRSIIALALFAPLPAAVRPGEEIPFRIGSLHPEDRGDALKQGLRTLELADRAEIPLVVVPKVDLEEPGRAGLPPLLGKKSTRRAWESLRNARRDSARLQIGSYLSTLSRLLDRGSRYGLSFALSLGGLPSEFPDIDELDRCLREFEGAPLRFWVDLLDAARYRRTLGAGLERLEEDWRPSIAGVAVGDGDGEKRHLPLGAGEVALKDWEKLGEGPAGGPAWVVDLAADTSEEDLIATREALEKFLFPEKEPPFDPFAS